MIVVSVVAWLRAVRGLRWARRASYVPARRISSIIGHTKKPPRALAPKQTHGAHASHRFRNYGMIARAKGEKSVHGPIPSAISAAIESNIALQAELQRRLIQIKCKKVQNRRDASRVIASISRKLAGDDLPLGKHPSSVTNNSTAAPLSKKFKRGQESIARSPCTSGEGGLRIATIDVHGYDASNIVPEYAKNSRPNGNYNPNRKWMRRFFIDKYGSTPEVIWRDTLGKYEKDTTHSTVVMFERNIDSHLSSEKVQTAWKNIQRENWKNSSLEEVAIKMYKTVGVYTPPEAPFSSRTPSAMPSYAPETFECDLRWAVPSSAEFLVPCFTFVDPKIAKTKFTKQECLHIMAMACALGGDKQQSVDWYELAMKHYTKFNRQTPWRCFSHFRSLLQNPVTTRCPPWTPDEDELLLKYLAVQGPQFLLQGDSAVQTCRNLFPHRSTVQLILRAQSTLVNPNYIHDAWSPDEKRKLALLMRAYSNEQNPLNLVSRTVHFPRRAPKSVAEKWIKTLNPVETLTLRK